MSWKPEVIADSTGEWYGNALRFATKEEAEQNVADLYRRWMSVKQTRVIESEDPVNYQWKDNRLVQICARCGHSVDEHNPSNGPCNHKTPTEHCICYALQ